jgi:hypothetical protein
MLIARNPLRIVSPGGYVVRTGYVDESSYDYGTLTGRITGFDALGLLASAETPDTFTTAPNTLYAFAQAVLTACQVPLELYGSAPAGGDPIIAYRGQYSNRNALELLRDAALDALALLWVRSDGRLAFGFYGAPGGTTVLLGDFGIPLADFHVARTDRGIVNQVADMVTGLVWSPDSITHWGPRPFSVDDRREPTSANWAGAILSDRAEAALELTPGEILPRTETELRTLIDAAALDQLTVWLLEFDRSWEGNRIVGGTFEGDGGGPYRVSVRTYLPSDPAWRYVPPSTPSGSADAWDSYAVTDAYVAWLPPGASPRLVGSGSHTALWVRGSPLAVGTDPARSRALIRFAPDWEDPEFPTRVVEKVELHLWLTANSVPASPMIRISAITGPWEEGYVADPPDNTNATIWPGPPGGAFADYPLGIANGAQGTTTWDVTALYRPYLPRTLGGSGLPFLGFLLQPVNETIAYQVSFDAREGAAGPWLTFTTRV